MTEGGLNMVSEESWWTEVLHKNIANKGISWALFWRNAWPDHYFAPFKGQKSSEDFIKFHAKENVLFLKALSQIK
ncbi:hypothetical protein [Maribacter sp. HTCC2170]|uniref:hypothetical protein n=1 Tax=Maribacter sp. (strain HTCC2170 / KCCM 42371) TaxID=313603 RepID=UPI00006B4766|nr:hypothetical protein [Maribacter sp. HTCC2170]